MEGEDRGPVSRDIFFNRFVCEGERKGSIVRGRRVAKERIFQDVTDLNKCKSCEEDPNGEGWVERSRGRWVCG